MKKFALAVFMLLALPVWAADCSTTECACVLVTYHDPAAAEGADIITEKFSWEQSAAKVNRRLGKYEMILFEWSYQDNGVHACCSIIDNDQAQEPWNSITVSHFAPG